jgi:hypothetical protein
VTRRAKHSLVGLLATLFVTLLAAVLPGATAAASPAAVAASTPNPIILIGTGGLTWSDVSAKGTPALWTFLRPRPVVPWRW